MIKFYKKFKFGIVMLLVLSMVLQVAGPWMDFAYAEENPPAVEDEIIEEDKKEEEVETESDSGEEESSEDDGLENVEDNEEDSEHEDSSEDKVDQEKPEQSDDTDKDKDEDFIGPKEDGEITSMFAPFAEVKDLGNIFTDVSISVNGEPIGVGNNRIEITSDTTVRLDFDWEIDDTTNLVSGDYSKIKIPDVLEGITTPMTGELSWNGKTVGTYSLDVNNDLTVTFNNELEGLTNRKGDVWFQMKFNETVIDEDANQIIRFEDGIDKEFEVTIKPGGETSAISKSGSLDQEINAEFINWSIDVNTVLEELTNASIQDTIPEGLEFVEGSMKIYDLKVGASGNISEIGLSAKTAAEFEVVLGKIDSAYRIKYQTKIIDYSKEGYNNIATLKDGDEVIDTAESDIGRLEIGSSIDKRGKANKSNKDSTEITWTIDVNKAELSLNNVSVVDTLEEGLSLKEGTIEIFELNKDGDNWNEGEKVTGEFNNFPLELGNLNKLAYRIRFVTKIDYDKYLVTNKFTNEAILIVNNEEKGRNDDTVTVTRGSLIEKAGVEGTSYGEPFVTWTIDLNKANHNIKDATVTDTIGDGLKLRKDSIKVYDTKIKAYVDSPNITDKTDNGFKVSFGTIDSHYRIEYITDIIDPSADLGNEGELEGEGLEGDGITNGVIKTGELNPGNTVKNSYTKNTQGTKTVDGIEYDGLNHTEKTMSWRITVDAKKEEITKLTITDIFEPAESMVFLLDSLRITVNDALVNESDYEITNNKHGGIVLEFKNSLQRAKYDIYYKTSFDPNSVLPNGTLNNTKSYTNKANFIGETKDVKGNTNGIIANDTAKYDINDVVFKGGKKDGVLYKDSRTIEWKIYVNAFGQNLKGESFVITDTLSSSGTMESGQEFDEGSFIVRQYTLNKNGTINPGAEIDKNDYSLVFNGDKFTLTFVNGIDQPYMVEYKTNILGIAKEEYKNVAEILGKDGLKKTYNKEVSYPDYKSFVVKAAPGVDKVYTNDEIQWELTINKSLSVIAEGAILEDTLSEGLVYVNDSLEISGLIKGDDYSFSEESNDGKTILTITFKNEIMETHTVKYTTVVLAENGQTIKNNASFNGESGKAKDDSKKEFTVTQLGGGTGSGENRGSIKVIKIDPEEDVTLEGVGFELYYLLNGLPQLINDNNGNTTHYTNNQGVIEFENLLLRTYYLREVEAPEGYNLIDDEIEIVIPDESGSKDIEYEFLNTKIKGNIQFIKKGEESDSNALEGAIFELFKKTDLTKSIQTQTSDSDGVVRFEEVPKGEYVIKETGTPTGYLKFEGVLETEIETNEQEKIQNDVINTIIRGHIEFIKHGDKNQPLAGAKFGIFLSSDENFETPVDTFITDIDGKVRFEDVPYGEYKIKEITAPLGYKPSDTILDVSIEENNKNVIGSENPVVNNRAIGDIEIIKKGENENNLSGAIFELVQNEEVKYTSEPTDSSGRAVFDNVLYGTYLIREKVAPEGYNLSDETQEVTITNPKGQTIQRFTFYNTKIRGDIQFTKYGETENPLQGAEFKIYKASDENFNNPVKTATSNAEGLVKFEGIEYGSYVILETEAPEGYNLSDVELEVEIKTEGQLIELDSVTNTKIRGNVEILKVDSLTKRPLKNATIGVFTRNDILVGEEKVTDDNGFVRFNGLEYGKYYFMETKSPYGYYLNRGKVDFEITENEKLLTFTLENTRIPEEPSEPEGRIRIVKRDSDTNELLSGAEFDVLDSRGRRVDALRTNSRGEATSRWLPVGYYTIEEVKAPNGYRLDSRLSEERIRNGETVEIIIYNEKVDPEDPDPTDPEDTDKPTDPEDPDPTDPTDPTDPDTPVEPDKPTTPGEDDEFEDGGGDKPSDKPEGEDEFEDGGGDKPGGKPGLPKTGSATPIFFYGLGGLSILVGAMLRRKKED